MRLLSFLPLHLATDEAIRFIERQGDDPFFLYVPYTAPHSPWAVRDADLKYVRECDKGKTTEYLFDLATDIGEKRNLLATRLQEAARLKTELADWERQIRPTR